MGLWILRFFNKSLKNELQDKVKDDPENAYPKHLQL
jgi:hypothetical protein